MTAKSQENSSDAINSLGLHNVSFDGRYWSFYSDWGNGMIGLFQLERLSDELFEGYASLSGQIIQKDRWIKER